ncbi:hypothetical protein SNE26_24415 [Mucilaginibacter sp. cycad4]|uniref:hypothetical protein n=1 Tax=Mucilaginibacter sp. cycad4 TaxID=3342096 RepID=UPI002AAB5428|nr:hypothetical protein [Mucilaginibacter gossypii]WPU99161.1 hypothetical protein SNE26_24415 [Mucilaginibacter gossypii]
MSIEQLLTNLKEGRWVSLSTEIRPGIVKSENGDIKPLYCTREFTFPANDQFTLKFITYADPYGQYPLVEMKMAGHISIGAQHPILEGAYEIDYAADVAFEIMPLHEQVTSALNKGPAADSVAWSIGISKNVFLKSVPAFGLSANEPFKEYDLIFIFENMLFNGARHIDGKPFNKPENRPTNLQIPLKKINKP